MSISVPFPVRTQLNIEQSLVWHLIWLPGLIDAALASFAIQMEVDIHLRRFLCAA
jgi:hypothetical protein